VKQPLLADATWQRMLSRTSLCRGHFVKGRQRQAGGSSGSTSLRECRSSAAGSTQEDGVADGIRTHDNRNHNQEKQLPASIKRLNKKKGQ
jgi:hypothetical protein